MQQPISTLFPGTHTVLIVDDEESIRENLERLLKGSGYKPTVAADGQEALDRISEQEFEVVLLDIKMPRLSGLDVLRQLQTDYPDTTVIMVTAVSDVEPAVEAMKLGAYDHVIKPFNLDDILMRIQKAVERRYLALKVKEYHEELAERVAEQAMQLRELTIQAVESVIQEETQARAQEGKPRGLSTGAELREFGSKILRRLGGS